MKRLAHIGRGNHTITFIWTGHDLKQYCYIFHAQSRAGLADILKQFRRAQHDLRQKLKSGNVEIEINCRQSRLSFLYIAAHNPTCKMKTRNRTDTRDYKKKYEFNIVTNGYQTFSSMRNALIKPLRLSRINFVENDIYKAGNYLLHVE